MRAERPGYLFDVITNGFGRMSGYASQMRAEDRWAVVADIRALQVSQSIRTSALAPVDLRHLAAQENRCWRQRRRICR